MGYENMTGGWANGLCECFGDCGSCLYASCCPSCAAGEIWDIGGLSGDNNEWAWWIGCCLYISLVQHVGCCLYSCLYTGQLREKKGIQGSCMGDFCEWCFCPCCTHVRNLREVRGT
eukprot:215053_1